jgi:NAD(P)-dependent dehydrogenase (short-subunit alcohol dehydrogenase family)
MPTYVITGANRGLGLEFVAQLSQNPSNKIIAGTRSVSPDKLKYLLSLTSKNENYIQILQCDTSSLNSIKSFADQVTSLLGPSSKIDYLLNNAGINSVPHQTALSLTPEGLQEQIAVNVLGPAKTVEALQQHLRDGSVVMNMTSGLGSLTYSKSKTSTNATAYSISKAGLNMLTVHQAVELKSKGVIVICMDPGWVKTDMGGKGAILEKEESIRGMLKCLSGLTVAESGKFFVYDGQEKAW